MNAVARHTEAKILTIVHEQGFIVMENLLSSLPESTWNQVFTSVDEPGFRSCVELM
jgi:hypothetical protein